MTMEISTDVQYRRLEDLNGKGNLCNIHTPLINIELDHVIPDELHMMLRVTDTLLEALITTATAYDRQQHHIAQRSRRKRLPAYKVLDGDMLNKLIEAINDCGVTFKMWFDRDDSEKDKSLNWTSLMGPDKIKLLQGLPEKLHSCQPTDMAKDIADLWKVYKWQQLANVYTFCHISVGFRRTIQFNIFPYT